MNLDELDVAMRAIADSLAEPGDVAAALQRIVKSAQDTVPGADEASITVRHADGHLETAASTSEIVLRADELQYELREGPCFDVVMSDETFTYSRDLSHDPQWPSFGPRIADWGLKSLLALPLADIGESRTALNLYARSGHAFDDNDGLPQLFASHARVALGYATELQTLQGAIGTRETIGKAMGLLMQRYELTEERAFEFLIRVSQNTNTKLRDVAAEMVRQGSIAVEQ